MNQKFCRIEKEGSPNNEKFINFIAGICLDSIPYILNALKHSNQTLWAIQA